MIQLTLNLNIPKNIYYPEKYWEELDDCAKMWNMDSINTMLKNIFSNDFNPLSKCCKAFHDFILLGELSDGGAAEIYVQMFWEVINVLTDDELSQYLQIIYFKYISIKDIFF